AGVQLGCFGGGGRFINPTACIGVNGVSGVGISFGLGRIYDVMEELRLFDAVNLALSTTQIMFVNFGEQAEQKAFEYVQQIRAEGIAAELYPDNSKLAKQLKYANAKNISFVAFLGEAELLNNTIQLKNMDSGAQEEYALQELIE